jgi:pimeloyl-ACP methyl ester carboxylesterase
MSSLQFASPEALMRDNRSNAMRGATFSRRDMLWAGGALAVGAAFAEPLKAASPESSVSGSEPTSWVDPAMPEVTHRMVETNGIRLHVAEQGEGPLIILCHDFPECWYSWRHQLGALAKAGFRAVAPDLRGYGRSDRPEEVEKYTILHDIGDIVGLVDALGSKQAVIAGHDIGATIAWQAAAFAPRPLPCRHRAQRAVPAARVWRLGAADDADAEQRRCGVLPALPPDSRGGGCARARHPAHVSFAALFALGRQAAVRERRVSRRHGAPEACFLDRSAVLAGLGHGVRHRCLCR